MRTTPALLEPQLTIRFVPETSGISAPVRSEMDASALRAAAANGFGDAGTPSSVIPVPLQVRPATFWQRVRSSLAALVERWMAERQWRAEHAALSRLDAATLRDLGISHSEIGSFAAESTGLSYTTRRRVVNRELIDRSLPYVKRIDQYL